MAQNRKSQGRSKKNYVKNAAQGKAKQKPTFPGAITMGAAAVVPPQTTSVNLPPEVPAVPAGLLAAAIDPAMESLEQRMLLSVSGFKPATNFDVGAGPKAVVSGDFNRDGKTDLIVANQTENDLTFLAGSGNGSFAAGTTFTAGTGPRAVVAGDFNGDNKLDLAVANQTGNNVSILLGDGSGGFAVTQTVTVGNGPLAIAAADIDGDGHLDLVTANFSASNVSVLTGAADGTFGTAHNYTVGTGPNSIATGDFNADGKTDIVVATASAVSELVNTNGTFGSPLTLGLAAGSSPKAIVVGDFNADGSPDVAVANSGNNTVGIFTGKGSSLFNNVHTYATGTTPVALAAADYNSDGKLDLAVTNQGSANVTSLPGAGDGSFGAAVNVSVGSNPVAIVAVDLNGDHKIDVAAVNKNDNNVSVLLDKSISATAAAQSITAGAALTGVGVGGFTDTEAGTVAGDYTASINWGDGTTASAGTVTANGGGSFSVTGSHTYHNQGVFTVTLSVVDSRGYNASATARATIADAPITATGSTVTTPVEGASFTGTVATFVDGNPFATADQFTAIIDWGDGDADTGTITDDGNGGFIVAGTHTWTVAGAQTATVDILDAGGSESLTTASITVNDAPLHLTASSISTTEGSAFSGKVAHFTDDNPFGAVGDYTAVVTWGDGTTSAGTVVTHVGGGFDINAGHTYDHSGSKTLRVDVSDTGGSTSHDSKSINVANATLAATGSDITKTEGVAFTGAVVAHFTDSNGAAGAADFSAVINWGDGTTSAATISASGDGFDVLGDHTFGHAGGKTVTTNITGAGGGRAAATSAATVNDNTITVTGSDFTATEGHTFLGRLVANFTDANAAAGLGDFSAVIHWGDGVTSVGTIANDGNGGFNVTGGHKYLHAGAPTVTIDVTGAGGSTTSNTANATVHNEAITVTTPAFGATEGSQFSGTVASFTDANAAATIGDFTAVIDWGDGTTSAATLTTGVNGAFNVNGVHTYPRDTAPTVSVTVTGLAGGTGTNSHAVAIADAALHSAGQNITATEGAAVTGALVATFTDDNPNGVAADYTAVITWGDGHTSAGTVQNHSGGGFEVVGDHTYDHAGTKTLSVVIGDDGDSTTLAGSHATVSDATITVTGNTVNATEGTAFVGQLVGNFTDSNAAATHGDFTAVIHWGDGATSAGTITDDGVGGFNVTGGHTYGHAGTKNVTVSITGAGGSTTTSDPATATIANAALTSNGNGVTIGAVEGVGNVGMLTAHFSDANAAAAKEDFTAVITWGDGSTSAGTISAANGGGFDVKGDHTWYHAGDKTITVDISGAGGGTTHATTAVGVDSQELSLTGHPFTVTEGNDTGATTLASFSDPNIQAVGADFTAVIHWADGATSAGTVVDNGGGTFDVTGAHAYDHAGAKDVVIDVISASTDTFHVHAAGTVNDAAITVTGNAFTRTEGESFGGQLVGHFDDANTNASHGDFTAVIAWGDGSTSFGTIADNVDDGGFDVRGAHRYAHAGNHTVTVSVTGAGGSTTTSTGVTAAVSNAVITASAATSTVTEGAAFTGKVVATFTDANTLATAGDFSAVITWGDGTTSAGTVQVHTGGGFEVVGDHSYDRSGDKSISVAVTGHGGGGDTAASTVHVQNATLTGAGEDIAGTEGAAITAPLVATFTDSNAAAQAADFTAVINWGDGTTDAGSVTLADGVFSVTGPDHTYARSGDKTITTTVTGAGGGIVAPTATAHVGNDILASSGHDFTVTEGSSFHNGLVATFSDANAGAQAGDFTAVITWGDGHTSAGTVQDHAGGGFEVVGAHQYAHAGGASLTVDITGAGGGTTQAHATATVQNDTITASPRTVSAVEGTPFTGAVVATFADANTLATAGDFSAVITWGDGSTGAGTVRDHNGGGFEVVGDHSYDRSGDKSISVAISGHGGGGDTAASTVHVGNQTLTPTANDFAATEGASLTGQLVATFTDANALAQAADFTSVIHWGDGTTSAGTVQDHAGGGFEVVGDHSYNHAGDKALTVDVLGAGGGVAHAHPAATVDDATISVSTTDFSATEGTPFVNRPVATFSDSNANAAKEDFTAVITWGDGTTSAGTIRDDSGGGFDVVGGHRYNHAGSKTFTVAVKGAGGSVNPSGNGTATVNNAAITATGGTVAATEAAQFTGVVGTFSDANGNAAAEDFTAVIDWGDGATSTGTVAAQDGGGFEVRGTHTYNLHGSYTLHFTATGAAGGNDSADSAVTVADLPITATGVNVTGTEGDAITGATVATFSNGNVNATANEFTAVITWGDGATSAGTVQSHLGGGFEVVGDHTYDHAGGKSLSVAIISTGGTHQTATATATIANAAIAVTSHAVSATETDSIGGATVASFTDANTHAAGADFTAVVNWGDGHTSAGVIVDNGGGAFDVTASHTYLHAGHFTATTTVTGGDGTGHSDHAAAEIAASIFGSGATAVPMTEGTLGTAVVLGDIRSNNADASAGDFTAEINWGDGTTGALVVSNNADYVGEGSDFLAAGAHNYAHAGVHTTTVTFTAADGTTYSAQGLVAVQDAAITVTATPVSNVTEGVAFTGKTVASFTDANGSASASDFTAVIDWGDGITSAGTVGDNGDGTFGVTGGHTFDHPGHSTVTVTVTGAGGSHHSDHAVASIASTLGSVTATSGQHLTEGQSQSVPVASFTDTNANGGAGDFTAVITWGDGTTSAGTVGGSAGSYTVSGSHAYDHAGSKATLVTVTAADGASLHDAGQVSVDDAAITVTGNNFTATEGTGFVNKHVAVFGDANANAAKEDFTAVITWGDGQTSAGAIVDNGDGTFGVTGGHNYLHAGPHDVTTAVTGAGGSTTSNVTPSVATVHNAALASSGKAITATEGASFTGAAVASFSDANLFATANDFTAVIHWGDGATSAGTITANGELFDVTGPSHTYDHAGPKVVTVDVIGAGGGTTTATGSAAVGNATLTSAGQNFGGTENASITAPLVATFTDSNVAATFDDFSAVIHWGDGATSVGVISANGGGFNVTGPNHTYLHSGDKTVTVDVTGAGGGTTTATATAAVANATLASTGHTFTATEGTAFTGALLASFTDSNTHAVGSDFSAVITWGDASTSAGTVVDNGSGHFDVTGGHTYQHAGGKSVSVLITGAGGGTTTATTTATVLNALMTATGTPFTVTEGDAVTGVQVAHFTDANAGAAAADFTAVITWGDGSTSAGSIAAGDGGFDVTGDHQYAHAGNKHVSIAVTGAGNGTASASTTATVNNAALAVTGHNITPTEGVSFTGAVVASFTDANALASAADFTAVITWGDGSTSAGSIAAGGGGFDVTGPAHTYAHSGDKTVAVAVTGNGGGTASNTATASVGNALITVAGKSVTGVEGNAITGGLVASFTDANASASVADFTATIDWGDGSTSAGTIAAGGGVFNVTGTHTYAQPATYTTTVSILGNGGGTASNTGFALVSVASINPVARNITGVAGAAFSGSVAGFTDGNPSKPATDFTATVNWGDGSSVSTATVTGLGNGVFDITADHTYHRAGSFLPHVTLTPNNAPVTTITSTMHVADAALTASGTAVAAVEGQALTGVTVATFSDANPFAGTDNFSAVVTWGDGATSVGVVASDDNNGFVVTGTHTYSHAGSKPVSVAILSDGGATASTTATATISNAALTGVAGSPISAVEGTTFTGTVASFSDANTDAVATDFHAVIRWGDGSTSNGAIVANVDGGFDVLGNHKYLHAGDKSITVDITGNGGGSTSGTDTATVANATLRATGKTVAATEGTAFTGALASFTDSNTSAAAGDFSAVITWGDGTTAVGAVVDNGTGHFDVTGTHTYAHSGNKVTAVSILGAGGGTTSATGSATVANATLAASSLGFTAVEGAAFTGTLVASFTDSNTAASGADFHAVITWGDGSTSSGTIVDNGSGQFDVTGNHAYSRSGTKGFSVDVTGNGGGTAHAAGSAAVANAALAAAGKSLTATEGAAVSGVVASFTDSNAAAVAADFSATLSWGDGMTSAGTIVDNGTGHFDVTGTHTYAHSGGKTVSVSVLGAGGGTASATTSVAVANATLIATRHNILATEGTAFTGKVVTSFTDSNSAASGADFQAVISWDDGSTSSGTIVDNGDGMFDVTADHTFAHAGSTTFDVGVTGAGGGHTGVTVTATVGNADLAATGAAVTATEGSAFSGTVASFTDSNGSAAAADFSATITWGDGKTSAGLIVDNGTGHFGVTGTHTYAHAGNQVTGVLVTGAGGGTAGAAGSATVNNATLSAATLGITATEGSAFTGKTVATFTDANAAAGGDDFTAVITWGDGTTSAGTIVDHSNGQFDVTGGHTYASAGNKTLRVDVSGQGGGTTHATGTAAVGNATLAGQGRTLSANEGTPFTGSVATFTDSNAAAIGADFSAVITWGDGSTAVGTVVDNGTGHFDVTGTHTYLHAGNPSVSVAFTGIGGGTAGATTQMHVGNAALTATKHDISTTEGAAFTGKLMASFTDGNTAATGDDFSALITWGDGTTSAGVIVDNGNGHFDVTGGHTYLHAGNTTFQVDISGAGGGSTSTTGSATVANASLDAVGKNITATEGLALSHAVVASFTDSNASAASDDFSAVITWGDGTTSVGVVVDKGAGHFDVTGDHTYLRAGGKFTGVSVLGAGGGTASASGSATVANGILTATKHDLAVTEGTLLSGILASFTDANTAADGSDFTALITWGDGTTSAGVVVDNGNGHFDVTGSHTWSHAGTDAVTIDFTGLGGGTIRASETATVSNAVLASEGVDVSTVEGTPLAGSTVVATFSDPNHLATTDDFSAVITWGDGSTSTGLVTGGTGSFNVTGGHTYNHAGDQAISVVINGATQGLASTTSTATVDNALLTSNGSTVTATEGTATGLKAVATFTDANTAAAAGDFTAVIDWGDGTTSLGAISATGGGNFTVRGGHTFAHAGTTVASVKVTGNGGGTTTADLAATVANAAITTTGRTITATEGTPLSDAVVASFQSANPLSTGDDFSAVITWGDGATSVGTVVDNGSGSFDVTGDHTYAKFGTKTLTVAITGLANGQSSGSSTVNIAHAALAGVSKSLTAVEGTTFTGTVASFTDGNGAAPASDFTAVITWGDGATSAGTVTKTGAGQFDVAGSHKYLHAGDKVATVTFRDSVATATASSAMHVDNAAIIVTPASPKAVEGTAFSGLVGSFTSANPAATAPEFTATITWNDGSTSTGKIAGTAATGFTVTAGHTFRRGGNSVYSLTITGLGGGTGSVLANTRVSSVPIKAVGATITKATRGTALTATLATFTEANALSLANDFTAVINWGDGTTSAGVPQGNGASGNFKVVGTHTYASAALYAPVVTITDVDGTTATAKGSIKVTKPVAAPRKGRKVGSANGGPTAHEQHLAHEAHVAHLAYLSRHPNA